MSLEKPWRCCLTADCCRAVESVVMTAQELGEVMGARPEVVIRYRMRPDGLVDLQARPCPYLDGSRCSVYVVRPYNCRRFSCGRLDTTVEPFTEMGWRERARVDRPYRRQLVQIQRKAQKWALKHGWDAGGG